jgi:hypothetical protein
MAHEFTIAGHMFRVNEGQVSIWPPHQIERRPSRRPRKRKGIAPLHLSIPYEPRKRNEGVTIWEPHLTRTNKEHEPIVQIPLPVLEGLLKTFGERFYERVRQELRPVTFEDLEQRGLCILIVAEPWAQRSFQRVEARGQQAETTRWYDLDEEFLADELEHLKRWIRPWSRFRGPSIGAG